MERERTERLILKTMGKLMRLLVGRQAYDEAAMVGQEILAADPLREEVHRAVMFCYWRLGRRARAVRQFQRCARLLQAELHILPMPETISLYSQIVRERLDQLQIDSHVGTPYEYELNSAIESFMDASNELNKLIELAESFWETPIPV
jgi:DNA-binding SARP family transcriptional activator